MVTGVPITWESLGSVFEGVSSTIFSLTPVLIGIAIMTIGVRLIPMLISRITHG